MKEKQMYPWKWNIQTKRYIASCCREPAREDRGAEAEAGDCAVLFANAAIIILLSLPDLFTMPASFPKEEPGDFFMGRKEQRETISEWIFDINSHFGLEVFFTWVTEIVLLLCKSG